MEKWGYHPRGTGREKRNGAGLESDIRFSHERVLTKRLDKGKKVEYVENVEVGMTEMKLGAKLGERDPRNLRLCNYLRPSKLPPPPASVNWDEGVKDRYRMWANDKYGDCVFAAFYNMLAGAAGQTGDPFSATDDDVLRDYGSVTGFNPSTGANDEGTNPEDALRFYSRNGKILAWGEVSKNNMVELRQALEIFGGIYTAFALPLSAQERMGKVWKVEKRFPSFKRIAGSWGGHMTMTMDIDSTRMKSVIRTVTWGKIQEMTEDFWHRYCSAAYFFITEKWISDNTGKTPAGLDLKTLMEDVKELKGSV